MTSRRGFLQGFSALLASTGLVRGDTARECETGVSPGAPSAASGGASDSWLIEELRERIFRYWDDWHCHPTQPHVWVHPERGEVRNVTSKYPHTIRLHPLLFRRLGWEMRQLAPSSPCHPQYGRLMFLGARVVEGPDGTDWVTRAEDVQPYHLEVLPAPELVWEGRP